MQENYDLHILHTYIIGLETAFIFHKPIDMLNLHVAHICQISDVTDIILISFR